MDGDSPSLPWFSLLDTGRTFRQQGSLPVGYAFWWRRGYALPTCGKNFAHRKMALSILNFLIRPHALSQQSPDGSQHHCIFWDCELSVGLIGSRLEGKELTIKTAPQYGFHRTSDSSSTAPYNILYQWRNHLCHCAKGDFLTVKRDTMEYISIKTVVQLFLFWHFVDLALHDFWIIGNMVWSLNCRCWIFILYTFFDEVYLLVILTLPDPSKIHTSYFRNGQSHPLCLCSGFFQGEPFDLAQTGIWIQALSIQLLCACLYVLMLIPFGMYLRLLFSVVLRKRFFWQPFSSPFWADPVIRSHFLIRVLPPSRCRGYYSKNTTGGGVGYLLGWFLVWLLPTRDEIDEHSFRVGTSVWFPDGSCLLDRLCNAISCLRVNRASRADSLCSRFWLFILAWFPCGGAKPLNGFVKFRLHFIKQNGFAPSYGESW